MGHIEIQLFGRFSIRRDGQILPNTDAHRVQELLSYLILHRSRPHHREVLAETIWGEVRPDQGRKYLRQTLWQLQSALDVSSESNEPSPLLIDSQWVHMNPDASMVVDAIELEREFREVCDVSGVDFTPNRAKAIDVAVSRYQGDLLDGWYEDWCVIPRERLRTMYLILLEKLAMHSEASREYERGLAYCHQVLEADRAREQTHRQVMRLYALSGDRASALRQFDRCVAALREEFDVQPDRLTVDLYDQIRSGSSTLSTHGQPSTPPANLSGVSATDQSLADVATHLRQAQLVIDAASQRLRVDLAAVERILGVAPPGDSTVRRPTRRCRDK